MNAFFIQISKFSKFPERKKLINILLGDFITYFSIVSDKTWSLFSKIQILQLSIPNKHSIIEKKSFINNKLHKLMRIHAP